MYHNQKMIAAQLLRLHSLNAVENTFTRNALPHGFKIFGRDFIR
jgi:hypothetical protein